jgi:hypothetical protein
MYAYMQSAAGIGELWLLQLGASPRYRRGFRTKSTRVCLHLLTLAVAEWKMVKCRRAKGAETGPGWAEMDGRMEGWMDVAVRNKMATADESSYSGWG